MLKILADWLKNKVCHYFVDDCNLVNNKVQSKIIVSRLVSWLSKWFVKNYLYKCAQLCPGRVSRLFDDVSTSMKLQNAVSAVVDWRINSELLDVRYVCHWAQYYVSFTVSKYHHLTAQSYGYLINELARIDSCLCDYFTVVTFLFITDRLARSSLSDGLLDILITIIGHFGGKRRYCNQLSSELLLLSEAVILTKDVNNSRSTVQQTDFELYKAYLCRVLRCTCEDSESNYCLANNYLAVLYYTSGQYKTSIDHCILVIRSQYHSQCSSHSVQGDLLSNVDDDIDITLTLD